MLYLPVELIQNDNNNNNRMKLIIGVRHAAHRQESPYILPVNMSLGMQIAAAYAKGPSKQVKYSISLKLANRENAELLAEAYKRKILGTTFTSEKTTTSI